MKKYEVKTKYEGNMKKFFQVPEPRRRLGIPRNMKKYLKNMNEL